MSIFGGLISRLDDSVCTEPAARAVDCYLDVQTLYCILA